MWRTRSAENLVDPVNKVEQFLRERRWNLRQQEMVEPIVNTKPLKDYTIPIEDELHCSIVHPPIAANNFELKPTLIAMVQQD